MADGSWDTPPTEDEVAQAEAGWDTPPTAEEQAVAGWDTPPTDAELDTADTTPTIPVSAPAAPPAASVTAPGTYALQLASNPFAVGRELDEANNDARVRAFFDAGIREAPGKRAGAYEMAKQMGFPGAVDVVHEHYDEFKATAERSGFNARAWRHKHPELAKLLLQQPHLAGVIWRDDKVVRFIREQDAITLDDVREMSLGELVGAAMPDMGFGPGDTPEVGTVRRVDTDKSGPRQDKSSLSAGAAAADVFQRGLKHSLIAKRGIKQMYHDLRDPNSEAAWREREAILRAQQELGIEPDYGASSIGRLGLAIPEAMASQTDSLGSIALGAAVGAATRSPQAAGVMIKAASAVTSFATETGGAYLEFLDTRDDEGRRVDPRMAAAAAALYGALAAGVEVIALSPQLKAFGPIGKAIAAGEGRAFMRQMLADRTKAGIFKGLAKDLAKSSLAEGGEEYTQEMLQVVTNWALRSASAGRAQSFDAGVAHERALGAAGMGALGGLVGLGSVQTTVAVAQEFANLRSSQRSGRQAAAIVGLAESETARQAPRAVAEIIKAETERSGEKVENLYVNPAALVVAVNQGGGDVAMAARDLMGENGPQRLQDALDEMVDAPGGRATLEVPLAEFFEKWGPKPITEGLVEDITTRPGLETRREQVLGQSGIEALAGKFADHMATLEDGGEVDAGTGVELAAGPNEQAVIAALEQQALATGRFTSRDEVRKSIATTRAVIRTMAQRINKPAEQIFAGMTMSIQRDPGSTDPASLAKIGEFHAGLADDTARAAEYYHDPNTRLLNLRGMEASPRPADRPLLAEFDLEGGKLLNDRHGHAALDGAFRAMADALHAQGIADGGKVGGSIRAWVRDEAHAREIAQAMRNAVDPRLRVTYAAAPASGKVEDTIQESSKAHKAIKGRLYGEGKLGHRKLVPAALRRDGDPQISAEKDMPGVALDSPEAQAVLARAADELAERAGELGKLAEGAVRTSAPVSTAALGAFGKIDSNQAFRDTYTENGILNEAGWHRARELNPKRFVVSADLRAFREMNDFFGRDGTDALNQFFSEIIATIGGGRFDAAHLHGDEYAFQGDSEAALQEFMANLKAMTDTFLFYLDDGESQVVVQEGLSFAYGIGRTFDDADRLQLPEAKREQDKRAAVKLPRKFASAEDADRALEGEGVRGDRRRVDVRALSSSRISQNQRRAKGEKLNQEVGLLTRSAKAQLLQALKDTRSKESAVLSDLTVSTVPQSKRRLPAWTNKEDAFDAVMQSVGGRDASPTEERDSKLLAGEKLDPFPAEQDIFDNFNRELDLEGNERARSVLDAWRKATKSVRSWADADEAIRLMRLIPGLEGLELPQEVIDFQTAERAEAEVRDRRNELFAERDAEAGLDTSFDVDSFDAFYPAGGSETILDQPAYHGTPHRGIEQDGFKLNKIGTGEGAQVYGWGIYFASKKDVAEWYREKLSQARYELLVSPEEAHAEVVARLRRVADELDAAVRAGADADVSDQADRARAQAGFMNHQGGDPRYGHLGPPTLTAQQVVDILGRYGAGRVSADELVKTEGGQLYKVEVPEDDELLDHDRPMYEQPDAVIAKLEKAGLLPAGAGAWVEAKRAYRAAPEGEAGRLARNDARVAMHRALPKDSQELEMEAPGVAFYKRLVDKHYWQENENYHQAASDELLAAGIPGLRYLDGSSRGRGEGSHNYVIWDESRMPITETLYQSGGGKDEKRGLIEITQAGARKAFRIFLTEQSDLSTLLHEQAHAYMEMFAELAKHPDADGRLRADWAATLKWLGADSYEALTVDQKEKWARGFEAYLREGKAPSSVLAEAFAAFGRWLKHVYKSLSVLDVEIDDEVRGVFDRLLATDAEIEIARAAMGIDKPMFRSPAEAGMTPEEWDDYLRRMSKSLTSTTMRVNREFHEAEARAAKAFKTAEFKRMKERARQEWAGRGDVRAWRYVKLGETEVDGRLVRAPNFTKLDRAVVEAMVGADSPFLKRLRGRLTAAGKHPSEVAEQFGFKTGADMLRALEVMPQDDKAWVQARAEELMREDHPEIDGEIARLDELVQEAAHNEGTSDWLMSELAAIQRKVLKVYNPETDTEQNVPLSRFPQGMNAQAVPLDAIRSSAAQFVSRKPVKGLRLAMVLNRERAAANEAAKAAAKGNPRLALVHKQKQLFYHYVWRETKNATQEIDGFKALAGKLAQDGYRARLGKASPAHRDVVDSLLEAIGWSLPIPLEEGVTRRGVDALVNAMLANGDSVGFDIDGIEALMARPSKWQEMSVAELRNVHDALKNIKKSATNRNTAIIDGTRHDRQGVIDLLIAEIRGNLPRLAPGSSSVPAASAAQRLMSFGRSGDAYLLKPETMIDFAGGGGIDSMWHKAVIQPLQHAKHREADLLHQTVKPLIEAFDGMPSGVRDRMMERVEGRELFPDHRDDLQPPTRRFELMMMALHYGTQSSRDRLTLGRGITEAQVEAMLSKLTKAELEWVQSVWDAAESLWPLSRDLEERDSGLPPEKLPAAPVEVTVEDGSVVKLNGGYFPAVYDRRVTEVGEKQAAQTVADLMDPSYTRPGTSRSHLKSRADEFADALSLDPLVIQSHFLKVTHDIAFRESLRSVGGLLLDPRIQSEMKKRLGDERARTFMQWLKDVGRMEGAQVDAHAGNLARWFRKIRSNTMLGALGYAFDIFVGDFTNIPVALAATPLKARHLSAAVVEAMRAPHEAREFVLGKSGEVRQRDEAVKTDFDHEIRAMTRGKLARAVDFYRDHAFLVAEWIDALTVTPVWLGAYRQALATGREDADAVEFADAILRRTFPSKSVVDKSAMQRDKGFIGSVLVFQGYLNVLYNLDRRILNPIFTARGAGARARAIAKAAAPYLALLFVSRILSEFLVGHGPEPEDGEDDAERWLNWTIRKAVVGVMTPVPKLGGMVESWVMGKKMSSRSEPVFSVLDEVGKQAVRAWSDDGDGEGVAWDLLRAVGLPLGIPARPLRAAEYVERAIGGAAIDTSPAGVVSGIVYGERGGQPTNPFTVIPR